MKANFTTHGLRRLSLLPNFPLAVVLLAAPLLTSCGGTSAQLTTPPPPPPAIGVSVSPSSATIIADGLQQFTAIVTPSGTNQAVTWGVSGTGCTGANCGTIDATGRYTAPATVPNPPTVTITATSVADPAKSGSATVTILGSSAMLLIRDTPPAGVVVLSFSVTVTGAVLQPGDVSLVTNPVSVEINRLQVETALLANLAIPSRTYSSLTVTFANSVLTVLNNSGAAIGSCANGAICKLNPALAVSSVNFTGQPFPVTGDGFVLLLDFDLSKSLSDLGTINPVVAVRQLQQAGLNQGSVRVKQILGRIVHVRSSADWVFGDDAALFDMVADRGTIKDVSDWGARWVDADLFCDFYYCVQDKLVESDLRRPPRRPPIWALPDWGTERNAVKSSDQTELEGMIVRINSDVSFDIVLLHQVPNVAVLELGDLVRINLQSGATIQAVDIDLTRTGLLFSAPSDLLVGQVVTARARSTPSGTPLAITTDRVRLKSGAFTARVQSIVNSTDFVVDTLPGNFPSAQIQVSTSSNTDFTNVAGGVLAGVSVLKAGDTVSFSGFLLKTSGTPVLLAEGVLKR